MDEKQFHDEFRSLMRRFGKVSTKQISTIVEVSPTTARRFLSKLVKSGKVKRCGKGRATVYSYP
jgi:DeoR/GlpR family transcriptional regulator of sugar metabolism